MPQFLDLVPRLELPNCEECVRCGHLTLARHTMLAPPSKLPRALLLVLVGSAQLLRSADATTVPSNLRVERLSERDALGVDGAGRLLLGWAFEHADSGDRAQRGAAAPAVRINVRDGSGAEVWSHRIPEGGATAVRYSGPVLLGAARYSWTVCSMAEHLPAPQCASSSFLTAPTSWGGARWIAGRQLRSPKLILGNKEVQQATVAVTGLGFYELRLNGEKVGDAELDPGFSTNYTERVLYAVHDVTAAVQNMSSGGLVLAARVGAGKYSMAVSHSNEITNSSVFALLCHLTVTLRDGTNLTLDTSEEWQVSTPPFVSEHLYHGEVYDARLALPGWDKFTYDPPQANWSAASVIQPPLGKDAVLSPRLFPPIRVVKIVTPVNATQLSPAPPNITTSWMYDLGNNFAGVPRVTLPTDIPTGHVMTIAVTEYPDEAVIPGRGTTYGQQDQYIFSGNEQQHDHYRPTFIYHGFRYVRVDNFPGTAEEAKVAVTGIFMHSDVTQHGNLTIDQTSSDGKVLAAVHASIVQTQACNIYSLPTDCPQREKRGWMGDAQWTAEEAILNFDMTALYANWIRTMSDLQDTGCTRVSGVAQLPMSSGANTNSYCCKPTPKGSNPLHPQIFYCSPQYDQNDTVGSIPDVVPNNWGNGGSRGWPGSPTWSVAYVIIPGHILQYDNDVSLIKTHYSGIKAHIDFLARQRKFGNGVPQFGLLGDWCSVEPFCPGSSDGCLSNPGWTNGDATSAFYFLKSVEDLIQMARVAGKGADVVTYTAMLKEAKQSYHRVFYNRTSECYGEAQTGNALAIAANVVPPEDMAGTLSSLTNNIISRGKHLSVGGVGARWLLQALTTANQTSLALDIAAQTTAPSWYDFVKAGPGTLHESWGTPPVPPSGGKLCNSDCEMLLVSGAGYFSGVGDQSLPGASSATSADQCSAACLKDSSCVQMTWAPTHAVKCSLYTSIREGPMQHNPQCLAAAVKCMRGATDPSTCAAFESSKGHPGTEGGSHNHPMFGGGIDPWLYHHVGGLRPPQAAGPPRVMLGVECEVMQRIRGATAETRIHGHRARSSWHWSGSTLEYSATIPVGFSGTLTVPGQCGGRATVLYEGEGDKPTMLWGSSEVETTTTKLQLPGVGQVRQNTDGSIVVELLSGIFHFSAAFTSG